jgi:hypothetical protein
LLADAAAIIIIVMLLLLLPPPPPPPPCGALGHGEMLFAPYRFREIPLFRSCI